MNLSKNIAVIGGGSWATALIKILCEGEVNIQWWMKNAEDVAYIQKHSVNRKYLSQVKIDQKKVTVSSDISAVVKEAEIVLLVVPAAFVKEALDILPPNAFNDKMIVSAIKGMIPQENILVTDYVQQRFGVKEAFLSVIAGPCHAEEVAMEKRSYLTIAGTDGSNIQRVADLLNCRFVKATVSSDFYGIEYAAIMKNVIAIACGIARGLNYGDNFQAVLVANAMKEIKRFVDAIRVHEGRDLNGSAYLGDLLVTSYSQFSRNRTLGNMIGRGYTVKSAQVEMNMIAEGYYAVKCIHEINAKYGVEMPILNAVYNILYEKISPPVEFRILEESMS